MSRRLSVLELRSVRGTGGGPEKTILLGAELRDRTSFAVTVCYLRDERDQIFGIGARASELDIDYVEVRERHSFDAGTWRQLKALVRDRQIDVVHGHDYKSNLLSLLLARRLGIVPITTAHGWTGQSARERFVYYPADKRLIARFPRAIAVSSEIRDELVACGARPDRVTVMLNAIDPGAFRRVAADEPEARAGLDCRPGNVVIGAVGRLEIQKRFDLLIQAFAPIARADRHCQLVIAGDGSLRRDLEGLAVDLGIGSQCRFLGHQRDIVPFHHALNLFVQSSEYEGTPNAVLEAMAMETPIVATDVGGTRELVQPDVDGVIVPTRDAAALTEAIRTTLADPAAARVRAAAARRRVETDLSFVTRTRKLEALYDEVAAGRRTLPIAALTSRVPHA